jgi:hypothetical protein
MSSFWSGPAHPTCMKFRLWFYRCCDRARTVLDWWEVIDFLLRLMT